MPLALQNGGLYEIVGVRVFDGDRAYSNDPLILISYF